MTAVLANSGNPIEINNDHIRFRQAASWNEPKVILVPSLASRLLLSRAIKASKPNRTKEVFSLMPVNRDAFSNILSSMLSVVLMHQCIIYPYLSIGKT